MRWAERWDGAIRLVVITADSSSRLGRLVDLTINLVFGMIGRLGVGPFPRSWAMPPAVRRVGTSRFHAGRHHDRGRAMIR